LQPRKRFLEKIGKADCWNREEDTPLRRGITP
jgi:hypothetical protein